MESARIPGGIWTWRRSALVLGVVVVPVIALGLLASDGRRIAETARFDGVIVSPAVLVSAIACYAAWRVNPRPGLAWTSFAVTLVGCQGLMLAAVQLLEFPAPIRGLWVLAADFTVALVIIACILLGRRVRFRPDPAAAGFAVGAVGATLRLVWIDRAPQLGASVPHAVAAPVFAAVVVTAALALLRIRSLPMWARLRMSATVLCIGAAHLALFLGDGRSAHAAAVVGDSLGAVALVSTSLALFFLEVRVDEERRSSLNDELERAQRGIRIHRARFHEINSTIAGITSASRLLRSAHPITDQRRRLLEDMIFAELSRLERLMSEPADARATRPMDLDETIGTLVVSQEARGRRVRWTPSGERVVAQADAVAEVINILLENAARHGRSAAEITVTRTDTAIEVAVHDDGPGVDHRVRGRLFDWGARGPRSSGQGIGLHIAHELMQRQGGYLEVREQGGGATFVLGLPTELPEEPPADLPEPGSLAVSADDEREERDDAAADLA